MNNEHAAPLGRSLEYLRNPLLEALEDQAVFEVGEGEGRARLAFTTDSYVVTPVFFPGGDIGRLAVCGTVNDLCVSGARPLYLAGVSVVTGDTKVVQKGGADRIFINTAGIGIIESPVQISAACAQVGDRVILSGTVGDQGTTHHDSARRVGA